MKERYEHITPSLKTSALQKELEATKNQALKLNAELNQARQENMQLKQSFQRKQDVAVRLIAQRNTARYLNDKVTSSLRRMLKQCGCAVARDISFEELIISIQKIVNDAWHNLGPIAEEKHLLKSELFKSQDLNSRYKKDFEFLIAETAKYKSYYESSNGSSKRRSKNDKSVQDEITNLKNQLEEKRHALGRVAAKAPSKKWVEPADSEPGNSHYIPYGGSHHTLYGSPAEMNEQGFIGEPSVVDYTLGNIGNSNTSPPPAQPPAQPADFSHVWGSVDLDDNEDEDV